jgi:23S rRNA (guanine2445-N2)-methyltransferase / 23S rRNA (guanine2069-N7)-methyltransferase
VLPLLSFFATASAGTEDLLAAELRAIGAIGIRPGRGGVRFTGEIPGALKACLWLRTAMRVLYPLSSFPAADEKQLYEGARAIDWRQHLDVRKTFAVEATGLSPTLRHTHFTALRVKDAIADSMRDAFGQRPDVEARSPDVRVIAHLSHDRCDVSLDVSGEPLFKRGYRLEPTKASLKETLAAAVLLSSGYDGTKPLVDPMCGSGTIALEAAMIAHGQAPGLMRSFGIERWPSFDATQRAAMKQLRDEARAAIRTEAPLIRASDRDPEAVAATQANIFRLKLPVQLEELDARELKPSDSPGYIVCNPPYGERLEAGGRKQLKTFFWQLGQQWRSHAGAHVSVLAGGPEFESAFGMRPVAKRNLYNGPIPCELLQYDIR